VGVGGCGWVVGCGCGHGRGWWWWCGGGIGTEEYGTNSQVFVHYYFIPGESAGLRHRFRVGIERVKPKSIKSASMGTRGTVSREVCTGTYSTERKEPKP